MRKFIAATTLGLFLASGLVSAPAAQAATIKTGVTCTKSGLTKKVGSTTYKCGRNPFSATPTKLTWATKQCFDSYAVYLSALDSYNSYKDLIPSLSAAEGAQIETMKTSADKLYNLLKTKACKKGV